MRDRRDDHPDGARRARATPMIVTGPAMAREVFDRLEAAIVDPDRAAGFLAEIFATGGTARVPGSPEPPD